MISQRQLFLARNTKQKGEVGSTSVTTSSPLLVLPENFHLIPPNFSVKNCIETIWEEGAVTKTGKKGPTTCKKKTCRKRVGKQNFAQTNGVG